MFQEVHPDPQAVHPAVPVVHIQVPGVRVLRGVRAAVLPGQGQAVHPAVPADPHPEVLLAGEEGK